MLGVQENSHSSCRSERVRKPQARLVSSVVFPATSTTCESTTVSKRGGSRAAVFERVRARLEAPLGSPLPSPSVWQPSRARCHNSAAALLQEVRRAGTCWMGPGQSRRLVGRGCRPLSPRARAHTPLPASLYHPAAQRAGRWSTVTQSQGGPQVRRSATAPARKCHERVQVGIKGRASRKRRPVSTVGRPGDSGSSDRVPHVGPYGTSNHAE